MFSKEDLIKQTLWLILKGDTGLAPLEYSFYLYVMSFCENAKFLFKCLIELWTILSFKRGILVEGNSFKLSDIC
jgi:hypothetical protein